MRTSGCATNPLPLLRLQRRGPPEPPRPADLIIATATGDPVMERNLRRALDAALAASALEANGKRLSWHALRHSAGSVWLSELGLPITSVSVGLAHSNPSVTLKCYGHESRDHAAIRDDVPARAEVAGIGG